ncbi:endonuclease/exonuclease/phosphatase family protein [Aestuariivivens insulae]|uniref:endonuclease/exonuclease/phosphatase family protein n=1 Tax=Aestuariivivens insulae TaxID=1621988 RepID=UPI001F56051D|nr:endonuclease/exonuclease/phosphatase family protein [Aestuariivivens insulae]
MKKTIIKLCFLCLGSIIGLHAQSVSPSKTTYAPNESITINFSGGPGNKTDWIGIFNQGVTPASGNNVDWFYVNGKKSSAGKTYTSGSVTFSSGLATAGTYDVHFLENDGYTILASTSIVVGNTPATGVSVSPTTMSLNTGSTGQLTSTVSPVGANQSVSWSSSNATVATVNSSGLVTAIAIGSATITATSTDGGFTATSTITVTTSASNPNYAMSFDGVDDQIDLTLPHINNWTVEAWVKGNGTWDTYENVVGSGWVYVSEWEDYPLLLTNGKPNLYRTGLIAPNALDHNWHHIASSFDGTTSRIFVDGVEVASQAGGRPICPNFIGSDDGKEFFSGQIDEVRIWKTAVPQATLANWTSKTIDPSHPNFNNLVAYYAFDDQAADATDMTGNYPGDIKNSDVYNASAVDAQYVANNNTAFTVASTNMQYVSSKVIQNNFDVTPGTTGAQVINFQVAMNGLDNPLSFSEINLDIAGAAALDNVHLYYLGTTPSTANKVEIFGSGIPAASSVTFSGSQNLSHGVNYFMVSFDVKTDAPKGTLLDAGVSSFKIGTASYVPDNHAPYGEKSVITTGNADIVRVLSWNIWHAGRESGYNEGVQRVIDVIKESKADIITMVESYGAQQEIANALGYNLYTLGAGDNLAILSRYPIVETYPSKFNSFYGIGVKVQLDNNREVIVYDVWLRYWGADYTLLQYSSAYTGQQWINGDNTTNKADITSIFTQDIDFYATDPNIPVIIGGDFNSGSHLDFTAAAAAAGLHNGWEVDLPTSHYMIDTKGYTDSYRTAHPDEVAHPGGTWSAFYNYCKDFRIDFLYHKGPNVAINGSKVINNTADAGMLFPSDHAGLLTTYDFSDGSVPVAVTGVSVTPTSLSLSAGSTGQLTATVSPANATNKSVIWSTSDPSVATVSSTGVVTAVAIGTATITATTNDGGFTSSSMITANETCNAIAQSSWTLQYVDSQEISGENGAATNAFDGNTSTIWHTEWSASQPAHPHEIQINLNSLYDICELKYLPRQTGTNGTIANYEIYVSDNPSNWGTAVASGAFAADQTEKTVSFPKKQGQYVRLVATSDINGSNYTSAAEINVGGTLIQAGAPTANFTASTTSITPGQQISFTDGSTNSPTSWSWSFTGGTPATSTAQNPTVTYNTEGTYSVTLTATNATGSDTMTKTGYITVSNSGSIKVLQFNIWQEGTSVPNGMTYIRDVIAQVNPDIVSFSEVRNYSGDWTTKIVNDLAGVGLTYNRGYANGADVSIISKYPITSTGTKVGAVSVFDVDVNGQSIIVAAAHLDYTYYATYLPRGYNCGGSAPYTGWDKIGRKNQSPQPVTDIAIITDQNLGSQRDEQIAAFINHVNGETRPVILVGDFNEPSHLDWTSGQANMFDHHGVVFPWHTTKSLEDNGFTDAFRAIYPDEVANPGITWPSVATGVGSTSWTPEADERDRIDYIFYRGTNVSATSAAIVGPKASYVNNVSSTSNTENDTFVADQLSWPSDHKGVTAVIDLSSGSSSKTTNEKQAKVSIDDHQTNPNIKVFPNPSTGIFNITCKGYEAFSYKVRSVLGQIVLQQNVSKNAALINLQTAPTGLYFVEVKAKDGIWTYKIIKE